MKLEEGLLLLGNDNLVVKSKGLRDPKCVDATR